MQQQQSLSASRASYLIETEQKNNGFITQPRTNDTYADQVNKIGQQTEGQQNYHIDKAIPPAFAEHQNYAEMPKQVEFKNLVSNILNSRDIKKKSDEQLEFDRRKNMQKSNKYERWKGYLMLEENKAVISDCFWVAICKYKVQKAQKLKKKEEESLYPPSDWNFKEDQYDDIVNQLLDRVARNYVNLLLSIEDQLDQDIFFKTYFDIVAQAVLYAFFYAFPKSRREFDNDLKRDLVAWFSEEFTGIPILNSEKQYWSKWNLYLLGQGNILKPKEKQNYSKDGDEVTQKKQSSYLPSIPLKGITNKRNKRNHMNIRFSPIVERYLKSYKYKTRNTIQKFKMKFTEYDRNQQKIDKHFKEYEDLAKGIKNHCNGLQKENNEQRQHLQQEIKKYKQETIKHHRRLEKRKEEELERGCHEYANYLVSMLNAGLSNANLGITNQKNVY
ncbi:hypothetical protein PPERSA_13150 [Pseudocohnilembus persalinus]|uniref:Uncharacterized protein n=1 Tax=Pseudocohnilembus persalinus TaxID=266149 RepID=A0A0V0QBL1_PSEPJ|nr:hypothetical protein PPERSA_13150 [Pseudocohnilembus persalinus]|eukprot:KRW99570.1 hypothetical protein PPERSA_13150 [Pseudocohnilembus persalinus]